MTHRLAALVTVTLLAGVAANAESQSLTIRRVDGSSRTLGAGELAALPRTSFEALDHGTPVRFEGMDLRAILMRAAAGPVDSLRGTLLRRALLLVGADGYAVAVALAELDESHAATKVYVVDRANGAPLRDGQAPLRAIVTGDARAGRWVRQLARVEVVELSVTGR